MSILAGTIGADTLTGGNAADTATGLSGADLVSGGQGRHTLSGGEGGDTLNGGDGDDVIYGFGASDRQDGSGDIVATRIVQGLNQPLFATSAPGDADRLFVVGKTGQIDILDTATGTTNGAAFLTIPADQLETSSEQGLLGLAFHPGYAANGKFHVFGTNADGNLEARQYLRSAANPDVADLASGDVILTVAHPNYSNHNGGWIGFGPDGHLYISTGDGGRGVIRTTMRRTRTACWARCCASR